MKQELLASTPIQLAKAGKKLILLLSGLIISTNISAQSTIEWQNTIGGSANDRTLSMQQTSDGGYVLGGYSNSNISGDKTENSEGGDDYWVVKIDTAGVIQWQNTLGGSGTDWLFSLKQAGDGGYLLGGYSDSPLSGDKSENSQGGFDYWVVKLDSLGAFQWDNTIGGSASDFLMSIRPTGDGGSILGGFSDSPISGDKTENGLGSYDYWVVKLDNGGLIIWQNTIGGNSDDRPFSVELTNDGGYFLGGYSFSDISGDKTENSQGLNDFWVLKLDSAGLILWQNSIGGSVGDRLNSVQQTTDGGYVLGGLSDSPISGDKTENSQGGYDLWVVKLCGSDTTYTSESICSGDSILLQGVYQNTSETYYDPIIGCTGTLATNLTVNVPAANAGADASICQGDSIQLSASGGVTYSWTPTASLSNSAISNPFASPSTTTVYEVTVSDGSGCMNIDSVTITVNSPPTVNILGNTSICEGESTILIASGGSSYLWNTGVITDSITLSPTTTTGYNVSVTDSSGCTDIDTVTVVVNPNPAKPTISVNGNTFTSSVTATSYQWFFNGDSIPGETGKFFTATQSGFYAVVIVDNNGCSAMSDDLNFTYIGIQKIALGFDITVYPNPNRGEFAVEIQVKQVQEIELRIFNLVGQVVFEDVMKQYAGTYHKLIDLRGYAKGTYELQIQTGTGAVNQSIIVE
ncbi:T9SS type A sorting domain-containing protein [Flavobacteriales bacterium AH-315-E23]|nr:T9SS type A sorting domain-containing protein [Flavobacteriales bacterium AH-315-E23]